MYRKLDKNNTKNDRTLTLLQNSLSFYSWLVITSGYNQLQKR